MAYGCCGGCEPITLPLPKGEAMSDFKFPSPDDVAVSVADFGKECERISVSIKSGSRTIQVHADIAKKVSDMLRSAGWSVTLSLVGSTSELTIAPQRRAVTRTQDPFPYSV